MAAFSGSDSGECGGSTVTESAGGGWSQRLAMAAAMASPSLQLSVGEGEGAEEALRPLPSSPFAPFMTGGEDREERGMDEGTVIVGEDGPERGWEEEWGEEVSDVMSE